MKELIFMVVEDERNSRDLVEELLHYRGIQTISVETGEQALQLLEGVTPHLILVDLDLPMMDGFDLLKAVLNNPVLAGVPLVAITAYDSPIVAAEALKAGFHSYFAKPIHAESFADELLSVIGG